MPSATEQTGSGSKTSPPSVRIEEVSPWELSAVWPVFRSQYLRMLKRGAGDSLTEGEIVMNISHGQYKMVVGYVDDKLVGSCLYQFLQYPKGLVVEVVGIAGWDMDVWKDPFCDYMDEVCDLARARSIQTFARGGTAKQLKERGWRTKALLMEKRYGRPISTDTADEQD